MNVGINNAMVWISGGTADFSSLQSIGRSMAPLEGTMGGNSFKNLIFQAMTQRLHSDAGNALMGKGSGLFDGRGGLITNADAALLLNLAESRDPEEQEAALQALLSFMTTNVNLQYAVEESAEEGTPTPEEESLSQNLEALGLETDDSLAGSQAQTTTAAESTSATDKGNEQRSAAREETLPKETSTAAKGNAEEKTAGQTGARGEELKTGQNAEGAKAATGNAPAKETAFTESLTGAQQGIQGPQTGQTNQVNNTAAGTEKAEAYSQISQEILSRLDKKGPMEFRMQLEPESLGKIDVNLKYHDGKLIIDILAASGKTQALLASQVDRLIQSMGLQNVQVENVQVNQQSSGQQHDGQGSAFFMNGRMDLFQGKGEQGSQQREEGHNTLSKGSVEADNPGSIANQPASYHRMDYIV